MSENRKKIMMISAVDAEENFSDLLIRAGSGEEIFIITRYGKPTAVIMGILGLQAVKDYLESQRDAFKEATASIQYLRRRKKR